jgi:hypothetical protein
MVSQCDKNDQQSHMTYLITPVELNCNVSTVNLWILSCVLVTTDGFLDLMNDFIGPSYNLLQHFTNHYLRLDILDFWPHYTKPLVQFNSQRKSELLYGWRFTANQFVFATRPLRITTCNFIFQLNTCGYSPLVTSSLTRGWVCRLQLLLVLASTVILRSESRGTHDHILLSQIQDSPNLEGQVHVFISPPPGRGLPSYTPRHWVPFSSPPTNGRATLASRYIASDRTPRKHVHCLAMDVLYCRVLL